MRGRFDLTDYLILAFVGIVCLALGVLIGTVIIGPHWFVSQNCAYYPFLLVNPSQYVACKLP
ncbi:hypothetical protein KSX_27270 [Ktedonospora formicarum]|uniref:Uncharacterized protein n=1 Tax=Ktedonospora formicarum TaxID=2778364 RepID=A0A8J3HVK0_9CHLR|nr:hypothetical protein KSX_27270 [Ktedonospora formicarum]